MNPKTIKESLSGFDHDTVDIYVAYLLKLQTEKNRKKELKNPWMAYKTDEDLIAAFKAVTKDGLALDGVHISITSLGVSYDYVAYKNKMLIVYPETIFDFGIVYKDDTFRFEKQSGKVVYSHNINNPFNQSEANVIGAYVVISNKRGEFLTLLSKENIDKCRKVARTDLIWKQWYNEMALKTAIKKAVKIHFSDIYSTVETLDNEQYDLDQPLGVDIKDKGDVEKITTLEKLGEFYHANKGRNAGCLEDFNKMVSARKAEIKEDEKRVRGVL